MTPAAKSDTPKRTVHHHCGITSRLTFFCANRSIRIECRVLARDCQSCIYKWSNSPNHFTTPFERPAAASSEKARSALKKAGCSALAATIVWRDEKAPVRRDDRPTEAMGRNMLWVGRENNERSGAGTSTGYEPSVMPPTVDAMGHKITKC